MPVGYYSGDRPNPNLRGFVEEHTKPYDSENDEYSVKAFNKPITTTKATALYNLHSYHQGKKPHNAIREYIRHFTEPNDIVMDPFCGSGGTALAALIEGRKAIAIDRSPAATFITKNYCTPVDPDELKTVYERIKKEVKSELDWLYETRCDRCGGKAVTGYTVYSQVFQCDRCLQRLPLFDCLEVTGSTASGKSKQVMVCPTCHEKGFLEEVSTRSEKFGHVPVLVSYHCLAGCSPARGERRHNDDSKKKRDYFTTYDLAKIAEIDKGQVPHWYPPHRMMNVEDDSTPWGAEWRQGRNFRRVAELYTKRNLWALSAFRNAIAKLSSPDSPSAASAIWTTITSVAFSGSRMLREEKRAIQTGTYYLPAVFREIRIANGIDYNMFQLGKAECELNRLIPHPAQLLISTQSATDLSKILPSSIDYIFTDPPYSNNVQYGELNFVWESWLKFDTRWHDEEIIVNDVRGFTEDEWATSDAQGNGRML